MRILVFLLLLFCACTQSYSQYFPVDTARLNQTYSALIAGPNTLEKQKAFLDAFPSSFSEYMMVYQYVPDPNYDLAMYLKGADHVLKGLGGISLIPDTTYCDKLINLSLNGKWNADAPNYLKTELMRICNPRLSDVEFAIPGSGKNQ